MKKKLWMTLLLVIVLCAATVFCVGCFGGNNNNNSNIDWEEHNNTDQSGNEGGSQGGSDHSDTATYTVRIHYTDSKVREIRTGEQMETFTATRDGYDFLGLFDSAVGGSMFVQANGTAVQLITKDTELYCQWAPKDITINLSTPVGRIDGKASYIVKAGEAFPDFGAPLYNQNQYSFAGWEYNGDLVSDGIRFFSGYGGAYDNYDLSDLTIDLIASFDLAKLKVVFDYNDGSYEQTEYETSYGAEFNFEYPEPTGIDREVLYWSDTPSGKDPYVPDKITGNLTLYAIWDDVKTVRFYLKPEIDLNVYNEVKYYRTRDVKVEDGVRDGYEFDGWYNTSNYFGNPISTFSFGSLLKAYYARWIPLNYKVDLHHNDEVYSSYDYTAADPEFDFPVPEEKEGYTFTGWADEDGNLYTKKPFDGTVPASLFSNYEANTYNVTVMVNGEVGLVTGVKYDTENFEITAPKVYGYDFVRYTINGEELSTDVFKYTEDITIVAEYEPTVYRINYNLDGGENAEQNPATFTVLDGEITLEDPHKDNYVFEGWYLGSEYNGVLLYPAVLTYKTEDYTVSALFTGELKAALFNTDGGSCSKEQQTVEYGSNYTLPICTKEKYSFIGWYPSEDPEAEPLTDDKGVSYQPWTFTDLNTTVYARYIRRYYVNIKMNYNGAAEVETNEYYLAGDLVKLDFVCDDGYDFNGYYDMSDIVKAYTTKYQFLMPDQDVTLNLKFSPHEYVIDLQLNESYCTAESVDVLYGQSFSLPVAYKEGMAFKGWKTGGDFITDAKGECLNNYEWKENLTVTPYFEETADQVIFIRTLDEFLEIQSNGNYLLLTDINLAGKKWTPIDFSGTLEGMNHKIKGLTQNLFNDVRGTVKDLSVEAQITLENTETAAKTIGIFAVSISGGLIDGVVTKGELITNGKYQVGGLAHRITNGTVQNCSNEATVNTDASITDCGTGGLFGYVDGGTITDCTNRGTVSGGRNMGGLIGWWRGGTLRQLSNYGEISGESHVGGVVGRTSFDSSRTYENIYLNNDGIVTGNTQVGGVVGYLAAERSDYYTNYSIKVTHLFNRGNVSGQSDVGGVIGKLYANNGDRYSFSFNVVALHNTGNVTGSYYVGGVIGYSYSDTSDSCVSNSSSKNATITAEYYVGGLFGRLDNNASFQSCDNSGMTVIATGYVVDGNEHNVFLGGYAGRSGTVNDCVNAIDIVYKEDGRFIGGIVGFSDGRVNGCSNSGNITAVNSSYVGGLVGKSYVNWSNTMENNSNSGKITAVSHVGGLIGMQQFERSDYYSNFSVTLKAQTNTGTIIGSGSFVGGIYGELNANNPDRYNFYFYVLDNKNTGNVTGGLYYVGGLFGYTYSDISDSYIKSSSSKNATVSGAYYVGGLVGRLQNPYMDTCSNEGMNIVANGYEQDGSEHNAFLGGYAGRSGSILNCTNASDITYEGDGRYVGGIVGYADGRVSGCSNSGKVTALTSSYVGGLFGKSYINWSATTENNTNSGDVKGIDFVGGIGGVQQLDRSDYYNNYSFTNQNITNSGNVIASGNYAGGMFGQIYANNGDRYNFLFYSTNCNNTGNVIGGTYVGGLVGHAFSDSGDSYFKSCSSKNVSIEGKSYVGGLVGYSQYPYLHSCDNTGTVLTCTEYSLDGTDRNAYFGGYVGRGTAVFYCNNASEIRYANNGRFVGGVAGYLSGRATNCSNTALIDAPDASYVGGIFGCSSLGYSATFEQLVNSGIVNGTDRVGGIGGELTDYISDYYNDYRLTLTVLKNTGNITGSSSYVGGLIGRLCAENWDRYSFYITFTLSDNTGNVTGTNCVGGVVGYNHTDNGADMTECTSKDCTIIGTYYVGGLVGQGDNTDLSSCSNSGVTVTATSYYIEASSGNMFAWVGGYAGECRYISGCTNNEDIIYDNLGRYVGGLAGLSRGRINNCKNTGNVYAPQSSHVGGLVGYARNNMSGTTSNNNVNEGNVTGLDHVGGIFGELSDWVDDYYNDYRFTLSNQTNSGNVTGRNNVGGIAGYFYLNNSNRYSYYATVTVMTGSGTITGTDGVGGLFGYTWSDNGMTCKLATFTGEVVGETNTGDMVGNNTRFNIE